MSARQLEPGCRLVLASHNPGKVREIGELMAAFDIAAVSAGELGLCDIEESGSSFLENAKIKADHAAQTSGLPALADDSGLAVAALNGRPGIYSARWAERDDGSRDFSAAMEAVEMALQKAGATSRPERGAKFICALVLAWPDGHVEQFEGSVHGTMVWPPRGDQGFGYDPVFVPAGHSHTFGEMTPARKHALSHRADAFAKLKAACLADG